MRRILALLAVVLAVGTAAVAVQTRLAPSARAALLATGCLGFILASLALTSMGSASASAATTPAAGQARPAFNVMNYGAAGNGTANDTPAINAAITAANAAGPGGGIVEFPAGTYLAGGSIHLMSNVTMRLDAGSVITAAATGFDPPEPNAYSQYQDYGHSHFHDSVIWGENLTNVAFTGSGKITGAGHLIPGTPNSGQADKLLTNYKFNNIVITDAGKSGLGMVSEDGAHISDVTYNHVVMSDTQSPIMEKIGTRLRCGGNPAVGSISDIHYNDVTGSSAGAFSPTLWGQPGHPVSDITFNDVHLTLPGGTGPMDPNSVPADNGDYNPNSLAARPAYGFYLRGVDGITFNDASLRLAADDARPAFIANTGSDITLRDVRVQAGSDSPFDVGFQDVAGYCLEGTRTTADGTPRVSTPGSSLTDKGCSAHLDNFSLSAAPASGGVTAGSSATFALRTAVTSGRPGPVTLTAASPQAGLVASVSPATVRPGQAATLTVSAAADAQNGTYQVPVTAVDATATQYATVTVTVTSVPAALTGAAWIRTANSSKSATENPLVTFTINTPATVAVAVDTRMGRLPWMDSGWTDSGTRITDSESTSRTFEVYTKTFPAGTVTLGPQADETNGTSMYTIGVF